MSDRIREAFEAWARGRGHDTTLYGDGNYADEVMDLHAAWLASRRVALEEAAAICAAEHLECPTRSDGDIAYDNAVRDCVSAIRREAEGQ